MIEELLATNEKLKQEIRRKEEAEKKLIKAKEKAEAASSAKSIFLSNMSHELRTPMNAVIGITNLMLEEGSLTGAQNSNLQTLKFSGESLLTLINDVLDFNKIEDGKIEFESVPFNLPELLMNVKNTFMLRAQEKGIQFVIIREKDVPSDLIGDPYRLTQILNNLISNALKFTREGSVTVNVSVVSSTSDKARVKFSVRDTGIGIAKEKQLQIFEVFMQANSDTTRKFGGSGLGLAISKKLIELQNGYIDIRSEQNKGSDFFFAIEYQKGLNNNQSAPLKTLKQGSSDLKGLNVLIAEDNQINQRVASGFLKQWGIKYEIASNGIEVLNKLRNSSQNRFDLILMDLQMPEMDGFQATVEVRKMANPIGNLPIVALSASVMKHERQKAFEAGMQDFVSKPFRPEELWKVLAKYADESVLSSPLAQ
ncbi:MAG: ATP-binding protein [Bacteroidota bacterium]